MKKRTYLAIGLGLSIFLGMANGDIQGVEAAGNKEALQISPSVKYYGEVKDGQPHGKGSIQWGPNKYYSGDWVNGKRSGTGKYVNSYYVNSYISEGKEQVKVVYNGSWSDDVRSGEGIGTEKTTLSSGEVRVNMYQAGMFKADQLVKGYTVMQALADPPFSFNYKNGDMSLQIYGDNQDINKSWMKGNTFSIDYKKGKVSKHYDVFPAEPGDNKTATLKYLQNIHKTIKPQLDEFQRLSKLVPLK